MSMCMPVIMTPPCWIETSHVYVDVYTCIDSGQSETEGCGANNITMKKKRCYETKWKWAIAWKNVQWDEYESIDMKWMKLSRRCCLGGGHLHSREKNVAESLIRKWAWMDSYFEQKWHCSFRHWSWYLSMYDILILLLILPIEWFILFYLVWSS